MQDHRYEALGKPVFEDLEPGCFAQVQSSADVYSALGQDLEPGCFAQVQSNVVTENRLYMIWSLAILHGYKAQL